jgi:hypothetical protein
LALLGAGKVVAQAGFEGVGGAGAEEEDQIQDDEESEGGEEERGKHFGAFLF